MMAYMCIKRQKECDGCGACQEPLTPCPECGNQEALWKGLGKIAFELDKLEKQLGGII